MSVDPHGYEVPIACAVNGRAVELTVRAHDLAIDVIRDTLGLTGTKRSCDVEVCGACAVLVDGRTVSSCTTLAVELDGREVRTIEGLGNPDGTLHPLQQSFLDHGALQCGFCTAGFLLTAHELLTDGVREREELREALEGNICRCTGYVTIMDAVVAAADSMDRADEGRRT